MTYALNGADFYETRGTEMYRLIAIVGCLALFVLALFYGKDPSIFAAALLVIVAMPEGSAISIQIERKDETDKLS